MRQQDVFLDVREEIRSGAAPCSKIMEFAARLSEGDTLRLIAPFEPTPLYEVLGREGFVHESSVLGGGDWEVRFTRKGGTASAQDSRNSARQGDVGRSGASREVLEVDARGLEPPQPMVRILEKLATLQEGAELRALTDRKPIHLFHQLEARGFQAVSEEYSEGGYITHIRRH